MYSSKNFIEFISLLRSASTPSDVHAAWEALTEPHDELRVVTALTDYSRNVTFPGVGIRDLSGKKIVTPYFLGDSLYFSSRKIIKQTMTQGEVKVPLDGSIMLDTNIASYISTYVYRRPFAHNQTEIVNVIRQLLENNPNYDYVYYLVENSKKLIDRYAPGSTPDADQLWSDLDSGFKDNLIALRLFLSIDNNKYRASNNDSPTISIAEAENVAKHFAHEFYFGTEGALNREMQIAIKYFEEGKRFSFFEKIDKGKHIPLNSIKAKISNMSWDLMIPRFIESLSAVAGNGQFYIPHYLTWDQGLKMSLNLYKAKACIFDDESRRVVTITEVDTEQLLRETVGDYYMNMYFESETVSKRYKSEPISDSELEELLIEVESELFSVAHA